MPQGKRKTRMEFIQEAKEIHGDKYGYDEVEYKGVRERVNIFCFTCNEAFKQTPEKHFMRRGCPTCAIKQRAEDKKRKAAENFVSKAMKIHGDKYCYDEVIYNGAHVKVQILCNTCYKHFQQTPDHHLTGQGCRICAIKQRAEDKKRKAAENFVSKAMKIHGDKFGYDDVVYNGCDKNVKIFCCTCNKTFEQLPLNHLKGHGCDICAMKQRAENKKRIAAENFVPRSEKVHGIGRFSYHEIVYKGQDKRVKIFCFECKKTFEQKPANHLQGRGCPTCMYTTEEHVHDNLVKILCPQGLKVTHTGLRMTDGVGKMDIKIDSNDGKSGFVEIDGRHHFEYVDEWKSNAIDVQMRDLEKHRRATKKGFWVVRIDQKWVLNSRNKGETKWIERLTETILKLTTNKEVSTDEMFLSDKANKYHEHPCYQYEQKEFKRIYPYYNNDNSSRYNEMRICAKELYTEEN